MTTTGTLRLCATLLALCVFSIHALALEAIPVLKSKTEDYANVTLLSQTPTHVFIQHSRGTASLKRSNVDESALAQLLTGASGSNVVATASGTTDNTPPKVSDAPPATGESFARSFKDVLPQNIVVIIMSLWLLILGFLLVLYLFYSYCIKLICVKAGYQPGILAWLPILRDYALFRASGMSVAWLFVLLSPGVLLGVVQGRFQGWEFVVLGDCLVAVIVHCFWCVRICQARGKGILAMIFLIIPFTYPFVFLYLAFSGGESEETDVAPSRRQTEPLPA